MAMIHVNRATTSLGIFSEQEVREGLSTGRFVSSDIGWCEGMASWQPLSQFQEFGATPFAVPPQPPIQPWATSTGIAPAGRTEPLAIWSFVLSLLGLACCGFVFGIAGAICGHLALSQIKQEPHLQGRGLALAGVIIGYAAAFFWLVYLIFFGGLSFLQALSQGKSS